jgi:hypothetical protein
VLSEKLAKFVHGVASVFGDSAHGEGIDWVVSGDGDKLGAVGHDDVAALANDFETSFFQSPDGVKVIDARQLWHKSNHDFDFSDIRPLEGFCDGRQIVLNG